MGRKPNFLINQLDFNEEQEEKFFLLDGAHRKTMAGFDIEILIYKKKVFTSFSNSNTIDDSIVLKIGEIESKREKEVFTFFTKVKAICNKNQAKKLVKILERAILDSGNNSQRPKRDNMPPPREGEGMRPPEHPPRD